MDLRNIGKIVVTVSTVLALTLPTNSASIAATGNQVPNKAKCVVLKNAVRKNYQLAQDIWRHQGFVVNPAKDSLGLNRWPVIDSNWFVVAQYPKAGSCLRSGSSVTASVRKYTD